MPLSRSGDSTARNVDRSVDGRGGAAALRLSLAHSRPFSHWVSPDLLHACVHQSITRSNDSADRDESILHREHDSNSRPPSPSSHSHPSLSALTMKQSPLLCCMIRLLCLQSPPGQQRKARAQCTVYSICDVSDCSCPPCPFTKGRQSTSVYNQIKKAQNGKVQRRGEGGASGDRPALHWQLACSESP